MNNNNVLYKFVNVTYYDCEVQFKPHVEYGLIDIFADRFTFKAVNNDQMKKSKTLMVHQFFHAFFHHDLEILYINVLY